MALEPVAGQVYFSPECHAAYAELGFSPSPGTLGGGVQLPDGPAYFTSRGSLLGQVPGEVVAAAFAVFNPDAVVPSVEFGWARVDAATICAARTTGRGGSARARPRGRARGSAAPPSCWRVAVAPLRPEGKPLFAGLLSLGLPGDPMGDMWRLADLLREYRGDAHTAAWTAAGLDATEVGLLTELYWGLPMRSYIRTRAWSDTQLDEAEGRLAARGLVADGGLTPTAARCGSPSRWPPTPSARSWSTRSATRFDELIGLLTPWGAALRDAGGYPPQGPHDLAPVR